MYQTSHIWLCWKCNESLDSYEYNLHILLLSYSTYWKIGPNVVWRRDVRFRKEIIDLTNVIHITLPFVFCKFLSWSRWFEFYILLEVLKKLLHDTRLRVNNVWPDNKKVDFGLTVRLPPKRCLQRKSDSFWNGNKFVKRLHTLRCGDIVRTGSETTTNLIFRKLNRNTHWNQLYNN